MAGFSEILGHEQIIEHLQNAIQMKKVSHAYILDGEEGAGKMMLARAFAQTLQCERGGIEPCGECHSCKQALSGNQPDIITVSHEKPASIGVEDIRGQLCGDIQIKPYSSPYKIYIVDEAEKMTVQAQNALLKTIEEPPAYGVILLLTTNADAFLPTILSRCVTLKLRPVKSEVIRAYLMEKYQIPDYQADVCTAFARGNVGKAQRLAQSEQFAELKEHLIHLLRHLRDMEIYELTEAVRSASEYKAEIGDYLDLIALWFRDVLLFKATRQIDGLVFAEEIGDISAQAQKSSYEGLERILKALEKAKVRLKANVNFELTMELLMLTIKEN
ncbi:DNA polymerase III subunit delta' [Candidatus Merdisoma sp. HCP28S3_D10]|uniref:DNA polymerase III subunit delta' n=1 Tax=unclassified Candidatus Merdisoma TaxID=3099611 RepID=UPI003F8CB77C